MALPCSMLCILIIIWVNTVQVTITRSHSFRFFSCEGFLSNKIYPNYKGMSSNHVTKVQQCVRGNMYYFLEVAGDVIHFPSKYFSFSKTVLQSFHWATLYIYIVQCYENSFSINFLVHVLKIFA